MIPIATESKQAWDTPGSTGWVGQGCSGSAAITRPKISSLQGRDPCSPSRAFHRAITAPCASILLTREMRYKVDGHLCDEDVKQKALSRDAPLPLSPELPMVAGSYTTQPSRSWLSPISRLTPVNHGVEQVCCVGLSIRINVPTNESRHGSRLSTQSSSSAEIMCPQRTLKYFYSYAKRYPGGVASFEAP